MNISVIIPCFNGEVFLAQAINSVLNQTLAPVEVLVVDNGSTDDSLALAQSFGGIVRTLTEARPGASTARKAGAAAAKGEALMFLDADDLLGPTALETLAGALATDPDVAVACCPWYRLEEENGMWIATPPSCASRRPGQDVLSAWLTGWYYPPCAVLWSRQAYQRSGGWDANIAVNNDGDIMMRAFVNGVRFVAAEEGGAYYRRQPHGQVSLSGTRVTRSGLESRIKILDRLAAMLGETGRLAAYRAPLGEAYDTIAANARKQFPAIETWALESARSHSGLPAVRRGRQLPKGVSERYGRWRRRIRDRFGPIPDSTVGETVRRMPLWDGVPMQDIAADDNGNGPLVSVVIPTYNRAALVCRAIDSVLTQTYRQLEVLVVDDGSSDNTAEAVAAYSDDRIRYLQQPENKGVSAARNRGIGEARGELIAFLDSDDEWMPDKLARQVDVFARASSRVGLVYSGVESIADGGRRSIELPLHRGYVFSKMLLVNVLHGAGASAVIRRQVAAVVGGFDERMPAVEDYDYWLRVTRFYEVDYVDAPLIRYHDQGVDSGQGDRSRRSLNFDANMEGRRTLYQRYGYEMRRAGVEHLFLLESARRHLYSPFGDKAAARRLVLQALWRRPTAYAPYPFLLPRWIRQILGPSVRKVRSLSLTALRRKTS